MKVDGQRQVKVFQAMTLLNNHNGNVGGVDNFDHLVSSYKVLQRLLISWPVLFLDLVEVAMLICSFL